MDPVLKKRILKHQRNEITEYHTYLKLMEVCKHDKNKCLLHKIAKEELSHYNFWKKHTGRDIKPSKFLVWKYYFLAKFFGGTFGFKLMERRETRESEFYSTVAKKIPGAKKILKEEQKHELMLVRIFDEEHLKYVSSIVLGLNDALVELTGALAGLTFALQNTVLIAATGFITGTAAAMSMAASEYLSIKTEDNGKSPARASFYTGITYMFTVLFLIMPYFILGNVYAALSWTIINAVIVIAIFNYYISITQEVSFKKRFFEMAALSLGVTTISFLVGLVVRFVINVQV